MITYIDFINESNVVLIYFSFFRLFVRFVLRVEYTPQFVRNFDIAWKNCTFLLTAYTHTHTHMYMQTGTHTHTHIAFICAIVWWSTIHESFWYYMFWDKFTFYTSYIWSNAMLSGYSYRRCGNLFDQFVYYFVVGVNVSSSGGGGGSGSTHTNLTIKYEMKTKISRYFN